MAPPNHTEPRACQPCWNGVAAHSEVGEGAQAEEEMIVIEYEMSITWNELSLWGGERPKGFILLSLWKNKLFRFALHQRTMTSCGSVPGECVYLMPWFKPPWKWKKTTQQMFYAPHISRSLCNCHDSYSLLYSIIIIFSFLSQKADLSIVQQ